MCVPFIFYKPCFTLDWPGVEEVSGPQGQQDMQDEDGQQVHTQEGLYSQQSCPVGPHHVDPRPLLLEGKEVK